MLEHNSTLTLLDVSGNQMKAEGAAALAEGLKANTGVQQLHVNSNGLDADAGKLFLPIVDKPHFEVFSGIPIKQIRENTVTKLDVKGSDGKQLEACGGIVLAHVLTGNTSVQELDVSANGLGVDGGKAIAASIADNSTIISVSYQKYAFSFIFTDLSFPFPLSAFSIHWVSSSMLLATPWARPAPRSSETRSW
jgi:Ran GTPase-activating protein (RanGAP) involved in mRNA processing and transport